MFENLTTTQLIMLVNHPDTSEYDKQVIIAILQQRAKTDIPFWTKQFI